MLQHSAAVCVAGLKGELLHLGCIHNADSVAKNILCSKRFATKTRVYIGQIRVGPSPFRFVCSPCFHLVYYCVRKITLAIYSDSQSVPER